MRVSSAAIWFGLFAAPAAWTVQTLIDLPTTSHACYPRLLPLQAPVFHAVQATVLIVSSLAIIICLGALLIAWRSWRTTHDEHHDQTGEGTRHATVHSLLETGEGRTRFMAYAGVMTSTVFLLASIGQTITLFLVSPCGM